MARLHYSLVKAALDSDHTAVAALTSESFDLAAPLKENGVTNIPTIGGGDTLTVRIGQSLELAHITAYTSGALTGTWTRGAEGSTPTAHSVGDIVRHVITDEDLSDGAVDSVNGETGTVVLTAADIDIADAGSDFTATDVEGALDELQADHEADAAALAAHLADTSDAHDASAISIADAGSYFTGTDVEAALQELGAGGGGGGAISVDEEGTPVVASASAINFVGADVTVTDGGSGEAVVTIASSGGGSLDEFGVALGMAGAETTGTWTANTATFYRLTVDRDTVVNHMVLFIIASSGNLDLGIYADDGTGLAPGSLIVSTGSVASPGTGRRAFPITETTLTAGVYWIAFAANNGTLSTAKSTSAFEIWRAMAQSKASSFPLPSSVSGLTTNAALPGVWVENLPLA